MNGKRFFDFFSNPLVPRVLLALVALSFIIYGISSGQAVSVFRKASQICMECIGIG